MAYNAIVAKISALDPHPNADRLQIATVLYNKVIVGLDQKVGDIGVFFHIGFQIDNHGIELLKILVRALLLHDPIPHYKAKNLI